MDDRLRRDIREIAGDVRSGATALLARAVAVLRAAAAADRGSLAAAAEELCRAQPSMAAFRVAASIALRSDDPLAALERFTLRTARAPSIVARHAAALLRLHRHSGAVRLVTCSRSSAVEQAIRTLAEQTQVEVFCAEGRPALEGRLLAAALAEAGIGVTLFSDAGIGSAIGGAEALLTGADAIGPDGFINKVGTGALAALATVEGVPTYVLAGREKVLSSKDFADLALGGGKGADVWDSPPRGVVVANPFFEHIPASLVAAFVTDGGVVPPSEISGQYI